MNRIFNPSAFFKIPDNTFLSPFLNSKDSMSGLPFDLINGFSIAMGRIEKNTSSLIHVHPYVDQVTFVLSGKINLRMKGNNESKPYKVILGNNQAGIAIKGEFFQLINPYDEDCNVLFIVSPLCPSTVILM